MSVALTLSALRQELNIGEPGAVQGTMTAPSPGTGTVVTDASRYDGDDLWDGGQMQDTTISGGSIQTIKTWTQATAQFQLLNAFSSSAGLDNYEVHVRLPFREIRSAINDGIAACGQSLRSAVRDETQVLTANTYQYTPNYAASPNRFFPQGVVKIEYQYWTGQPTRQYIELPQGNDGWFYLDDETIQFPEWVVDSFPSNTIRFSGYGPVSAFIASDDPATAIGTFDDDFQTRMLVHACESYCWRRIAYKLSAQEQSAAFQFADYAMKDFEAARQAWTRRAAVVRSVILPMTASGWRG